MSLTPINFNLIRPGEILTAGKGCVVWLKTTDGVVCIAAPTNDAKNNSLSIIQPGRSIEIRGGQDIRSVLGEVDFWVLDADYYLNDECIHRTYKLSN